MTGTSSVFQEHDGDLNVLCSIVEAIEDCADIEATRNAWLRGIGDKVRDYSEDVCRLLDDSRLDEFAFTLIPGTYGVAEEQIETLREFCKAFVAVVERYPAVGVSDAEVLESPEWQRVVQASEPAVAAWASWRADICDGCYAKGWR